MSYTASNPGPGQTDCDRGTEPATKRASSRPFPVQPGQSPGPIRSPHRARPGVEETP